MENQTVTKIKAFSLISFMNFIREANPGLMHGKHLVIYVPVILILQQVKIKWRKKKLR